MFYKLKNLEEIGYKLLKINDLIAKSKNGTEIIVSLIPLHKMQNTRQGFKEIEVGKSLLKSKQVFISKTP